MAKSWEKWLTVGKSSEKWENFGNVAKSWEKWLKIGKSS